MMNPAAFDWAGAELCQACRGRDAKTAGACRAKIERVTPARPQKAELAKR